MFTQSDKDYFEKTYITKVVFEKSMDAIGERFDTLEGRFESSQNKQTEILLDIVKRLQRMEEKDGDHSYIYKLQDKRLNRIETVLSLPALAM